MKALTICSCRCVPPCAVKTCAVRPGFARVVGELRAADLGFGKRGLLEKGSFQKSPFSRDSREFRDSRSLPDYVTLCPLGSGFRLLCLVCGGPDHSRRALFLHEHSGCSIEANPDAAGAASAYAR